MKEPKGNKPPCGSWELWYGLVTKDERPPQPDSEHLAKLMEGAESWNKWRADNKDIRPNLKGANLNEMNLESTNLVGADLEQARLCKANLRSADCYHANFKDAILHQADLSGADIRGVNFEGADLMLANLRDATAINTSFKNAHVNQTNIKGANLMTADFDGACVIRIEFNRRAKYFGIRVNNCYGNPRFRRFAQDQDFIEEFRTCSRWRFLYWPWLILMDCGRSFGLWIAWSLFFAILFGVAYAGHDVFNHLAWLPNGLRELLHDITPQLKGCERTPFTPYYFSVVTFTTLGFGDVVPLNLAGEIWVTIEVVFGYIMLGGLISILANKIARRA